ncbi:c-type cytochrome [Vibrio splendidus]
MKTLLLITATLASGIAYAEAELPDRQTELPAVEKPQDNKYLVPRDLVDIPTGEFGDKVKLGYSLFVDSQQMRGTFVGNEQNCVNCHMQAGMKPNAAPLWGAYMAYPAYRSKNDKVNSYAERIQGCFTYSMNGLPPAEGSKEMVALTAYSYWLAMGGILDKNGMQDTPVPEISDAHLQVGGKAESFPLPEELLSKYPIDDRSKLAGRGYPKIDNPEQEPSIARGEKVYQTSCQTCHGQNGEGIKGADGRSYLPPLWGENSFNWGAGMHRVNTAAYFIYENMPLGKSQQLSIQDAWDVAAFVNSHERPQDPRYKGDVAGNAKRYHNHQGYYGKEVDGNVLGSKAYPSGKKVIHEH